MPGGTETEAAVAGHAVEHMAAGPLPAAPDLPGLPSTPDTRFDRAPVTVRPAPPVSTGTGTTGATDPAGTTDAPLDGAALPGAQAGTGTGESLPASAGDTGTPVGELPSVVEREVAVIEREVTTTAEAPATDGDEPQVSGEDGDASTAEETVLGGGFRLR
ncbi:hypothetical protein ACQP10_02385 [Streptosporangium sandarakinum]|uniref:hypothetical protein n=1 Tax=Streptosporangium sandarakinum TaxID=1260955 RepID=UPI003D905D72